MIVLVVLISGVAVAIPLLGGLVMVGMGVSWLNHSLCQSTDHEQN